MQFLYILFVQNLSIWINIATFAPQMKTKAKQRQNKTSAKIQQKIKISK
jgi:hypothetical protein